MKAKTSTPAASHAVTCLRSFGMNRSIKSRIHAQTATLMAGRAAPRLKLSRLGTCMVFPLWQQLRNRRYIRLHLRHQLTHTGIHRMEKDKRLNTDQDGGNGNGDQRRILRPV